MQVANDQEGKEKLVIFVENLKSWGKTNGNYRTQRISRKFLHPNKIGSLRVDLSFFLNNQSRKGKKRK